MYVKIHIFFSMLLDSESTWSNKTRYVIHRRAFASPCIVDPYCTLGSGAMNCCDVPLASTPRDEAVRMLRETLAGIECLEVQQ